MNDGADEKLEQLIKDISSVPLPQRDKLLELANRTSKCHKQLTESIARLQNSLDGLRFYIFFNTICLRSKVTSN